MNNEIIHLDNKKREMYRNYIILSAIFCAGILFFIEQILMVDYLTKTLSKIVLFTLSQVIFIKLMRKTTFKEGLNLKIVNRKNIGLGIILGIIAGAILIIAFLIFKKLINMETIFLELEAKSKITSSNYLFVTTYFSFGNSFLEEFFFRGFIFINLYKMGYKKTAYIFSAGLFSLYHIGIFKNWFNMEIFLLCLFGLVVAGLVFNYVDTKSENFLNSWAIHIIADVTIVVIGYLYLF
ncbi:MAG: type II CAAX endopeptidase family protein [Romboutsia sp.]